MISPPKCLLRYGGKKVEQGPFRISCLDGTAELKGSGTGGKTCQGKIIRPGNNEADKSYEKKKASALFMP